jgi:hypothetical protein
MNAARYYRSRLLGATFRAVEGDTGKWWTFTQVWPEGGTNSFEVLGYAIQETYDRVNYSALSRGARRRVAKLRETMPGCAREAIVP